MMKRGKTIVRNYTTLQFDFSGIRLIDGYLSPVDWQLSLDLIIPDRRGKNGEVENKANTMYQKLHFWLDTNLPDVVIIDVNKEDDLYISNISSNIMLYCPYHPSDDVIIQLLHCKLSHICKKDLMIGEMRLKSSDTVIQNVFDTTDGQYDLPLLTKEYYTEGIVRDEIPWWYRDDGFCFEFSKPEGQEEDPFKNITDPMLEFDKAISEMSDSNVNPTKEPARIVQIEKWKPKKV